MPPDNVRLHALLPCNNRKSLPLLYNSVKFRKRHREQNVLVALHIEGVIIRRVIDILQIDNL